MKSLPFSQKKVPLLSEASPYRIGNTASPPPGIVESIQSDSQGFNLHWFSLFAMSTKRGAKRPENRHAKTSRCAIFAFKQETFFSLTKPYNFAFTDAAVTVTTKLVILLRALYTNVNKRP